MHIEPSDCAHLNRSEAGRGAGRGVRLARAVAPPDGAGTHRWSSRRCPRSVGRGVQPRGGAHGTIPLPPARRGTGGGLCAQRAGPRELYPRRSLEPSCPGTRAGLLTLTSLDKLGFENLTP